MGFADNLPPPVHSCPFCGQKLRDLERVVAKHVPASVPEHVSQAPYTVSRRFVICECDNGHRVERHSDGMVRSVDRLATVWHS